MLHIRANQQTTSRMKRPRWVLHGQPVTIARVRAEPGALFMNPTKTYRRSFFISVNGRPYLGESDETVDASPRWTGWTGKSPAKRSRIKLGEFLTGPGKEIIGRINLRSELDRIMREADAGLQIEKLEIARESGGQQTEKGKRMSGEKTQENGQVPSVGSGNGSAIPAIQSAALNLGTAARDADNALESWDEEKWEDSVMWINNAIAQLESARAKITTHASLPNTTISHAGEAPLSQVSSTRVGL